VSRKGQSVHTLAQVLRSVHPKEVTAEALQRPSGRLSSHAQQKGTHVRTARSLTRVRLAACAAAALTALGLLAAPAAAAAHTTYGGQQPPPRVKQSASSPLITVSMTSTGKTPQETTECTAKPNQTYTWDWNAHNTLTSVYVQNYDTASCPIVMSAIAEDDNLVTPHEGTHNIGKAACTACASLPVYGTYLCTSGVACAGKYVAVWNIVLTLPPGYVFTSWAPYCVPSDDNVILTCSGSTPYTVAPYFPCTPGAGADAHVSTGGKPPNITYTASGHGWYILGDCGAPTATVTAVLQEYFSNGEWVTMATKTKAAPPGRKWANPRYPCVNTAVAGWRTVVSVSVIAQAGTASDTATENLGCSAAYPGAAGKPAPAP
jgi:hypothetical protein